MGAQMKLNAQLDVAQKPTGSAVLITDTVPPLLMIAHPSNCPIYSQKRLPSPVAHLTMDAQRPPVAQMKLNAQLDVAQKLTGSAAQTTDTVPPLLMTAHPSNCPIYSQKRLQSPVVHLIMDAQKPPVAQMKLNAQPDVAQ